MTSDRYMHADLIGEFGEGQPGAVAEDRKPFVNWPSQPLARHGHQLVLEHCPRIGKTKRTTHLLVGGGRLSSMGDARHKRSPKEGTPREVTPLLIKQVEAALSANEVYNIQHKLRKGDRGYRPKSHQDIADEIDADPNSIKNMFGGVRPGTCLLYTSPSPRD